MVQDGIKTLNETLKKILEGVNIIKDSGLNQEFLICYLVVHTKMSRKSIELLLKSQEEFYNKLVLPKIEKLI